MSWQDQPPQMERTMTRTALMTTAATLVGLTMLVSAHGYTQPAPMAPPQAVLDQNLLDMKDLAAKGDQLKTDTEAALKDFDDKQHILEEAANDARTAGQNVDDLIKLLRAAADRLGPNGDYIKILKQQEEFVRDLAAKAMASENTGDHVYGEQLASQGAQIGALHAEANALAAKLAAQIDRVERGKTQIAYAYAVKRTDDFIKTARAYLEGARKLLQDTTDLVAKGNGIIAPTVPSQ